MKKIRRLKAGDYLQLVIEVVKEIESGRLLGDDSFDLTVLREDDVIIVYILVMLFGVTIASFGMTRLGVLVNINEEKNYILTEIKKGIALYHQTAGL